MLSLGTTQFFLMGGVKASVQFDKLKNLNYDDYLKYHQGEEYENFFNSSIPDTFHFFLG